MITRRSFLKFLGLLPAAPVVAKLPAPEPVVTEVAEVAGHTLDASRYSAAYTVFAEPSNNLRAMYAKELAESMRKHMDKCLYETLTRKT